MSVNVRSAEGELLSLSSSSYAMPPTHRTGGEQVRPEHHSQPTHPPMRLKS